MGKSIEVYANGLFGSDQPDHNEKALSLLAGSAFTGYILFALHVHPSGDLYYNDDVIVSDGRLANGFAYLPPLLDSLRHAGEIWWSIGGWQVPDFSHIGTLLASPQGREILKNNFIALGAAIPVTGFDLDMEENYEPAMRATIVDFTGFVAQTLGKAVSFCPYMDEQFWLNCLADVYQAQGSQPVSRFRLQCYAGGTGNTTQEWLGYLERFDRPLGILNLGSFVLPSNWVSSDDGRIKNTPHDIQQFFATPLVKDGAGGGFLWCTSEIFDSDYTPADYADAVIRGLGG
jgi:hypothetical protein